MLRDVNEMGPRGLRRGRGARERILAAAERLFRERGISATGMDQLCEEAQVSKRTAYQHFGSKDELVAAYLRGRDPDTMPEVFDRMDLSPRQRLLAAFEVSPSEQGVPPLCPFIGAILRRRRAAAAAATGPSGRRGSGCSPPSKYRHPSRACHRCARMAIL